MAIKSQLLACSGNNPVCLNPVGLILKRNPLYPIVQNSLTGLFPEQASNWDFMANKIKESKRDDLRILNLFAYTGGATMACSKAGAKEVVHVDASKGMIQWAKENMQLSNLQDHTIRFIVDDCIKFVKREQRRGRKYDGIVMDPPSYGRGPNGELWKLEEELFPLIQECMKILSDDALFFIVNCYTTGFSCSTLNEALSRSIHRMIKNGIQFYPEWMVC